MKINAVINVGGDNCYNRRTGYQCPYYDNGDTFAGINGDNYRCSCLLFNLCMSANKYSNVTPHDACLAALEADITHINADHSTGG